MKKLLAVMLTAASVSAIGVSPASATPPASPFPATESVDTFERSAENPLNDGGKWSKLAWTKTIGRVYSANYGWVPKEGGLEAPESEADGAYWNAREYSDPAVSVRIYPEERKDYAALWADTTGTGVKNGYRLKVEGSRTSLKFKLLLEKWVGGQRTVLGEAPEVTFAAHSHEDAVGLTVVNNKVTAWFAKHESSEGQSEFAPVIEAADPGTAFAKGHVGIEGTDDTAFGETRYRAGSPSVSFYLDESTEERGEPGKPFPPGEVVTANFGPWGAGYNYTHLQTIKGETSHYVNCEKLDSDWTFVNPGEGTATWKIEHWEPSECKQVGYCEPNEAVGLELSPLHVEIDTYLGTNGYRFSHFRPSFTVTCSKKGVVAKIVMAKNINDGVLAAYWSNGRYSATGVPPNLDLEDGGSYGERYGNGGDMELENSGGQQVIEPKIEWAYLGYDGFAGDVIPTR